VLYPVFIHTYLRLVSRASAPLASDLLRAHRSRMASAGGRASAARAHEMQQLQAVGLPQHLETHPFAKAALDRAARPLVRMCAYSFELLMHFLHSHKMWFMLAIINEHLRFEVRADVVFVVKGQGRSGWRARTCLDARAWREFKAGASPLPCCPAAAPQGPPLPAPPCLTRPLSLSATPPTTHPTLLPAAGL
jgi:hypothetical protein